MDPFTSICKKIKQVKIQGAENIAKAAVIALHHRSDKRSIKKLLTLRPTEPCLRNAIHHALHHGTKSTLDYFHHADKKISTLGAKLIKNNSTIYTHCHSSTIINILHEAKHQGKKFKVLNTETRPLFQGRRTSRDLSKLKIPNIHFVDSAMRLAIKNSNMVLLGADAVTPQKVYNKIGSELVAETAQRYKVPLYICTISLKFDPKATHAKQTPLEQRPEKEVWPNPPKRVRICNPAFEKINPELIKAIVSELGILTFKQFVRKAKSQHPWI